MFVCRFNLSGAKHAGPSTAHQNSVFDEFCIFDEAHVREAPLTSTEPLARAVYMNLKLRIDPAPGCGAVDAEGRAISVSTRWGLKGLMSPAVELRRKAHAPKLAACW